jgi:uncharacterized membrane protein
MTDHKENNGPETNTGVARVTRTELYSGPLPHPKTLQEFESIVLGSAERIISMAESQSKHRMELERSVIKSDIDNSKRGQILALL